MSSDSLIRAFLHDAEVSEPTRLPRVLAQRLRSLGVEHVVIYLVDLSQRRLLPLPVADVEPRDRPPAIEIDDTAAGACFRTLEPVRLDASTAWLPLVRGSERVGVALVSTADPPQPPTDLDAVQGRLDVVAHLLGTLSRVSDTVLLARRTAPLSLAAEIQRGQLPPASWADERGGISLVLEPAYDVAGDGVDYCIDDDVLSFSIIDGMGHGLASAQMSALVLAVHRNQRRNGASLSTQVSAIDDVLAAEYPDAFTTAVFARLDLGTGALEWANLAHPDPLLFRDGGLVGPLVVERSSPLGLRTPDEASRGARWPALGSCRLLPGDVVLLYTDGVTEARDPEGEEFGEARLAGLVTRYLGEGLLAAEVLRRVSVDLGDHQGARLHDDATLLLVEWAGPRSAPAPA